MDDIFEKLTTVKEAARKLGVTTGYVRRLCLKHGLGRVLGRDRLLARDDLASLEKLLKPDD